MKNDIDTLVDYIKSIDDFIIVEELDGNYNHMGATIVDAVLQSGLNYANVVKPRVDSLIKQYSSKRTTSEFLDLCSSVGIKNLIRWQDDRKPNLILAIAQILQENKVETCEQFSTWIDQESSVMKLRNMKGVGPKTIDYLNILLGKEAVAVDIHLKKFVAKAGIKISEYSSINSLISAAAEKLHVKPSILDHSIWTYMSKKS